MRPVRLVMQAFGPYAGREVVDFGDAVAAGLFGIYGQTGAGKSTIFSAITFALFGSATKEEQATASLRSDHASLTDATVVEFIFDLAERRYMIIRSPDQPRPKRRGDGETWEAHEAHLFDVTGLTFAEIDAGARGTVIAEKKTGVVFAAVTELLGYGPRQFRQIVLLPQGKFETFLAANTKDRMEILRDLFDVSLFRRLTARFKTDADEAERDVRAQREACAARLKIEGFESTDALRLGVTDAGEIHAKRAEIEAARQKEERASAATLDAAKDLDGRFAEVAAAHATLKVLLQDKTEMDALAARIVRVEAARGALDREEAKAAAAKDKGSAEAARDAARQRSEHAASMRDAAAQAFDRERARDPEVQGLRRDLDDLRRHEKSIADASSAKRAADDAKTSETEIAAVRVAAEVARTALLEQRVRAKETLRLAQETEERRRGLDGELASARGALKAADSYVKAEADHQMAGQTVTRLEHARDAALAEVEAAKEAFDAAEARLSEMQALHLASKLATGEPCPVCGGTDHPSPATGQAEQAGLDAAFRGAKSRWGEKDQAAREAVNAHGGALGVLTERRRALDELDRPDRGIGELRDLVARRQGELDDLGAPAELGVLAGALDAFETKISAAEAERDRLRDAAALASTLAATSLARLEQMLTGVPGHLQNAEAIAAALVATGGSLHARTEARAQAETAERMSREASLSSEKDLEAADAALVRARERQAAAQGAFDARLEEVGLTVEAFESLKPLIAQIDVDREMVDGHRAKLAGAQEHLRQRQAAVEGRERPILAEIEQVHAVTAQGLRVATEERAEAQARLGHLERLLSDLSDVLRQLDEAEAATGPLRLLASQFDAGNSQRLDLETYAIGAMFDAVLDAANLRAGPMTDGRYKLEREAEGGGRGRKGLGIQVFDAYTGKSRSASTLSGGETFIAALALALGLADVVESASGKVRLDTVFIDEGFGSLDAENGAGTLDVVLRVLSNLTSVNRAVGLISHVPLVQEAIPHGFYVTKSGAGSTIETRRRA
ncbi:AAA family ATPase [Chenggangzhangella methanolivorans]|uniref:AAA family ATPase n=1 Tax=Chenggangzhangella methanolivorans TaxID=1437009 RepID=UPI00360D2368